MKYGPAFVRSLIFVWLATWVPADPIAFLQVLLAPAEYADASYAFRHDSAGTQFAKHHAEALIGSSTEGGDQRSEESPADEDELGALSPTDPQGLDPARSIRLAVGSYPSGFFSALTPPRAPPSLSF